MSNRPLPPRQPPWELANVSEGRPEPSAASPQECSTSGPQTSIESPAIVASSNVHPSSQGLQPQITPPPTDPQHPASGGFRSQGPPSFSNPNPPQHVMPQTQAQGPEGSFSMRDMSRALHERNLLTPVGQQYGQQYQQRFPTGPANASAPALVYQIQPEMPLLAGQTAASYQNNPMWPMNYPQHYQTIYQQNLHSAIGPGYPQFVQPHQVQPTSMNPTQSQHPSAHWLPQQHPPHQAADSYAYFARPFNASGQGALPAHIVSSHSTPLYPVPYPRRSSLPAYQSSTSRPDGEYEGIHPHGGIATSSAYRTSNPQTRSGSVPSRLLPSVETEFWSSYNDIFIADVSGSSGSSSNLAGASPSPPHPSMLRGPPRKPKQSGHALWVGNLPPGTSVVDLKDHFSADARADIESVFLISKSNCAFVNYKTEAACTSAMARFHDSRFQGVRLVCRLRRGSATLSPSTPTGPAASAQAFSSECAPLPPEAHSGEAQGEERDTVITSSASREDPERPKERYFIVKSLTVEDLDISVQNGTWATQSHNEEALNEAFEVRFRSPDVVDECADALQSSESVYLIFSANKSGEYYGYARMASKISGESSSLAASWTPRTPVVESLDLPRAIPTPATKCAPKGRIIDDSARGTIFWEADDDNEDASVPKDGQDNSSEKSEDGEDGMTSSKSWGKPFKIEWLSTTRLPFYRTRGLRNSWNSNREVKIARDGTELETSVGRRLLMAFHRSTPSPAGINAAAVGYQQIRQF